MDQLRQICKQWAWRLLPYLGAVVLVMAAVGVRTALNPVLGNRVPFGIFFIAVLGSAWLGFGPSIVSLLLGVLAAAYFFIPPDDSLQINTAPDIFSVTVYFIVGLASAVLSHSLRMAKARAEESAKENAWLNEELKTADRRKDDFLAAVAHELRSPLAPIRNAIAVARVHGHDSDAILNACDILRRQVDCMVRLVDDLSDLSRIKQNKIEVRRRPTLLAPIITQAVEMSQPQILAKDHDLHVSCPKEPIWLDADAVRLAQIVSNLLTNSAKYTERGGWIRLTVRTDGDTAIIQVKDSGIGIAKSELEHVFETYVQTEQAKDHSQGGLGIGLALVKSLVELHDGSVEAFSQGVGQGSSFTVRLPVLANPPEGAWSSAASTQINSRKRRVLVVDDTADAADSLAMLLELEGHRTEVAYSGAAALRAAESFRPDVVLLDIEMPEMNGFEVAARLRRTETGTGVLLIALTGWGQSDYLQRAKAAGFDLHLVKPVNLEQLSSTLADKGLSASGA